MIKLLLNSILAATIAVCMFADSTVELGKEFTLKKNKTAVLAGSDLKITMRGAGRSQRSKGGDVIYCEIDIAAGGSQDKATLDVGESIPAGGHFIKLTKVDLTVTPNAKDPWESNTCSFIVTKTKE